MKTLLSKNFSLEELIYSKRAEDAGIDNIPSNELILNGGRLARTVLQPLRDWIGAPVLVHSAYRCPELNKLIKGAANSDHVRFLAADITVPSMKLWTVFERIAYEAPFMFGQLIYEDLDKSRYGEEWIHISVGMKKQCLVATRTEAGVVVYTPFTKDSV